MIGTIAPNWLDRLAQRWGRASKALPTPGDIYRNDAQVTSHPLVFPGWDQLEARGRADNGKDQNLAKQAVQSAWVFADVQAIANEASAAELVIQEPSGEDIEQHPLELLWETPNAHMGRSFVISMWVWSYVLTGKAYLYWVPAGGTIKEVWPIPSFMITPIPDAKDFIKGYAFRSRADAAPVLIPPQYITYSHSVNPFDVRDGMSFLVAAMTAIRGDLAAANWNLNFFGPNNGVPDGLIAVKQETLDSDLARIRLELRDFFGGTRRGVAVARAGDMAYTPFGRTQKDAEFITGRTFSRSEIDRALGFPEGYWSETANRANAEQARATMIAGAVWPLLVRLHEDINAQLIPRWFPGVKAAFKDIRPQDRVLKLSEFTAYQAVLTVDELRELIDRDPLGDVRGMMLVAEIGKGTPIPTSAPSTEMEATLDELEAEAAPEEAPADDVPLDDAAPVEDAPMDDAAPVKALDLARWERKALKAFKARGRAGVAFESAAIPADEHARITDALKAAQTAEDVRAAFEPGDEWEAAVQWAVEAQQ